MQSSVTFESFEFSFVTIKSLVDSAAGVSSAFVQFSPAESQSSPISVKLCKTVQRVDGERGTATVKFPMGAHPWRKTNWKAFCHRTILWLMAIQLNCLSCVDISTRSASAFAYATHVLDNRLKIFWTWNPYLLHFEDYALTWIEYMTCNNSLFLIY